ncbi:hypothetical protein Fot_14992 [Forsythia ovata]|uniref:Uncharacterized protein n=1 Tax=Forsythia ovata TaxID=205694 RepID=A0ABD1W7V8_9LAMI
MTTARPNQQKITTTTYCIFSLSFSSSPTLPSITNTHLHIVATRKPQIIDPNLILADSYLVDGYDNSLDDLQLRFRKKKTSDSVAVVMCKFRVDGEELVMAVSDFDGVWWCVSLRSLLLAG